MLHFLNEACGFTLASLPNQPATIFHNILKDGTSHFTLSCSKQASILSSAAGPFQSTSARQLSAPAGRGNVTDDQSKTGCKGGHCSQLPGSGRKYSGGGKNADSGGWDNGSLSTDSSMTVIQASTARKKSSAGLGENIPVRFDCQVRSFSITVIQSREPSHVSRVMGCTKRSLHVSLA